MSSNVFNMILPEISVDKTGQSTYIARKGIFVIVLIIVIPLIWAWVAPISGAIIAPGVVKIVSSRKTIQHLDGGVVKEILVKDGSIVKRDQPLIILEDTKSSSDLNILSDELDALRAKEARLTAEKLLSANVKYPADMLKKNTSTVRELMEKENSLFRTKRNALMQQIALLQEEISHAKQTQLSLDQQIKSIEENIKYKQDQVQMREGLYEKKFVGRTDVLNYKQVLTDKQESLSEANADKSRMAQQIADLQLRMVSLKSQYAETADSDLKDTAKQIFEMQERIRPAQGALDRSIIKSPIDGQVIDLKVTTLGGIVRPSEPLLDIVPQSSELVVEVRVKTTDIDQTQVGQHARVQLSAYNYKSTPLVNGDVVYVATDALTDTKSGSMYYPAHVKIHPEDLKNLAHVNITPGMPADAFIQTKSRTFIEYFLEPVTRGMRKTFREE